MNVLKNALELLEINEKGSKKHIPNYIPKKYRTYKYLKTIKSKLETAVIFLVEPSTREGSKFFLISCCGTKNIFAWKENVDCYPLNQDIMDGFLDGFYSIHKEVFSWLSAFYREYKVQNILFMGYSRGGAIVQILRYYLKKYTTVNFNVLGTITFASPKVFRNSEYTSYCYGNIEYDELDAIEGCKTFHIAQVNDPIPTLPPCFLNYCRTGSLIPIGKVNKFWSKVPIIRVLIFHPYRKYKKDLKKLEIKNYF